MNIRTIGVERSLDNYWSKEAMEEHFFQFLHDFLYEGDYYTRVMANKIINESNFKPNTKSQLKKFIKEIEYDGLSTVIKEKRYNNTSIVERIKKLNKIGVNPIPISTLTEQSRHVNHLPNLLKLGKEIAEEKYFR